MLAETASEWSSMKTKVPEESAKSHTESASRFPRVKGSKDASAKVQSDLKQLSHKAADQPVSQAPLAFRFAITEENLALRREFIRLTDQEMAVMSELLPWAKSVAAKVAQEFYDWQFAFAPTRDFFERHAKKRGVPLAALRKALEENSSQALYRFLRGSFV